MTKKFPDIPLIFLQHWVSYTKNRVLSNIFGNTVEPYEGAVENVYIDREWLHSVKGACQFKLNLNKKKRIFSIVKLIIPNFHKKNPSVWYWHLFYPIRCNVVFGKWTKPSRKKEMKLHLFLLFAIAEMPTSGDLKTRDSLFRTTPHPASNVNGPTTPHPLTHKLTQWPWPGTLYEVKICFHHCNDEIICQWLHGKMSQKPYNE